MGANSCFLHRLRSFGFNVDSHWPLSDSSSLHAMVRLEEPWFNDTCPGRPPPFASFVGSDGGLSGPNSLGMARSWPLVISIRSCGAYPAACRPSTATGPHPSSWACQSPSLTGTVTEFPVCIGSITNLSVPDLVELHPLLKKKVAEAQCTTCSPVELSVGEPNACTLSCASNLQLPFVAKPCQPWQPGLASCQVLLHPEYAVKAGKWATCRAAFVLVVTHVLCILTPFPDPYRPNIDDSTSLSLLTLQ